MQKSCTFSASKTLIQSQSTKSYCKILLLNRQLRLRLAHQDCGSKQPAALRQAYTPTQVIYYGCGKYSMPNTDKRMPLYDVKNKQIIVNKSG